MPTMDSTAKAALDTQAFAPAWFIWADAVGDPIRITTLGKDFSFSSTGDADLDGNTFTAFDATMIQVGQVTNSENGSDTLTADMSGIVSIDATLLAAIGDTTKWRGRTMRLWFAIYDADGVTQQGAIVAYYTGYMSAVDLIPSTTTQTIRMKVENYLAAFNQASNRSYMNQKDYDPADTSAAATLACSNGAKHVKDNVGAGGAGSAYHNGFRVHYD
jgi:hypothetical protein